MTWTPPYDSAIVKIVLERLAAGDDQRDIYRDTGVTESTQRRWRKNNRLEKESNSITAQPVPSAIPRLKIPKPEDAVVLAIPDLHCPFEHPHALLFLQAVRAKYSPTHIICLGDEVDFHAMSRYDHDPNGLSAGNELKQAKEHLIPFYKEFPEVMVCESNHTIRGHKLAFGSGLPSAFLNHIATILSAPDGWKWANHWIIDGVRYFHGDAGRSGQYAHMQYLKMFKQSLIHGHIHSFAGVNYEGHHFGGNAGCLINEDAYAFAYGKHFPIRPSLGCMMVFGGHRATFIPMITDINGNWVGSL
jgi:hypothetical protein